MRMLNRRWITQYDLSTSSVRSSIMNMIIRSCLRALLRSTPRQYYSTTPPATNAPAFKFPRRWEMVVDANNDVYANLCGLTQFRQFANFLKDNLRYFTDQHLGFLYSLFRRQNLELDNHFYDVILPITKEYIKKFTFQDTDSLSPVIQACLFLKVEDDGFWDLILQKLHKEKCYKYISIPDVLEIAAGFLANPKLSTHPVMAEFAKVLDQQKEFFAKYSPGDFEKAKLLSSRITTHLKSVQIQRKQLESEVKKIQQS